MLTSGGLSALQEIIASFIARDGGKHGHYFNSRVPKMAAYGAFVSAPLGHFLINILQRLFSGRTSLTAKILQILVSNLIVRVPGPPFHTLALFSPNVIGHNTEKGYDRLTLYLQSVLLDRTHSKFGVLSFNGRHRRRSHLPPSPRYGAFRLLACHAGVVGRIAASIGVCAEVPA